MLIGVGVGPGEPELMTLKAVRAIKESDVIFIPNGGGERSYAYRIAEGAVSNIGEKEIRTAAFPMTKDEAVLKSALDDIAGEVCRLLDTGKQVAFLTIGDPSVYSTYQYIHRRVTESGRQAQVVGGVPSFCAAAARLGISLGDKGEEIHIIPASYDIEASASYEGTRIYMKSGRELERLIAFLAKEAEEKTKQGGKYSVYAVSDCGLKSEKVMVGIEELACADGLGYLTIVIVKTR